MEPTSTSLIDDAEFSLPPEFLTDDDFLVEKENKDDRFNNCLFPYDSSHKFESDSSFGSSVKPMDDDEEKLLAGLTRKMAQSSLEDDLSGGFSAFLARNNDTKAWGSNRCVAGGLQNRNCHTTEAWNLHYAGTEKELTSTNRNGYNNHNGRGLLDLPRKKSIASAKIPNDVSNRQSLQYLQAIQFQQQQLIRRHRELVQQRQSIGLGEANDNNKIAGSVDVSPSAWSNQHVFIGNRTGKRGSTGTGVFLPRCVNHATVKVGEKPSMLVKDLVPVRVVQPSVRSSPSLNDGSWSQRINNGEFSNQMKMEQPVNDSRLPSDWAY